MNIFLKDIGTQHPVTWDDLLHDLKKIHAYNPYCLSGSFITVFQHIILSMLLEKEAILLDSDFSADEMRKLTGHSSFDDFSRPLPAGFLVPDDKETLIRRLKKTSDNWTISLYTSGTTGLPKKVIHTFSSVTRFIKFFTDGEKRVWGFAYNPTHMAGVQVFLQALLNGDTLVRLFGLSTDTILDEIDTCCVTHISATPTFYKLLTPADRTFPSVKRITSGGEKFNASIMAQLSAVFPNAKITNIYASTEAGALFASNSDLFTVRPEFSHLVRIENNELLIHATLMGASDLCRGEWYKTGDIVETVSTTPLEFRFMHRRDDLINVGGYKVNPLEVEEVILDIDGVRDVRVYSRSNSVLGNIICCDIVSNDSHLDEAAVRMALKSKLQDYKIPRIIRFVDTLATTRTGKTVR